MTILNTFYLLFKSNAQDVIKGNKEIERSSKNTESALKNTNEEASKLGQSYVRMVEGAATAAGTIAGYNILKTGISETVQLNTQLRVMSDLTGVNARQMQALGYAAESVGGSMQGVLGNIQALSQVATQSGKVLNIEQYFNSLRERMRGMDIVNKNMTLDRAGITEPGLRWMLAASSDEDYARRTAKFHSLSRATPEALNNALTLSEAETTLNASKSGFWNRLTNVLTHPIDSTMEGFSKAAQFFGGSDAAALAGGAGVAGGTALGWRAIAGRILGRGAATAAGTAAAEGAAGVNLGGAGFGLAGTGAAAATGIAGAAGGAMGYMFAQGMPQYLQDWIVKQLAGGADPNADYHLGPRVTPSGEAPQGDMAYWMGKGYSREQAAGIIANMNKESGGNPGARGDGGRAHGLFQWHPDRRAAIMEGTGIDVSKASYEEQRDAAAWEMRNESQFNDQFFRTIQGADQAGAYFSKFYERPANGTYEALMRGQSALGIAASYPTLGGARAGNSVTIGEINIQTQATDATGIAQSLEEVLNRELSNVQGNFDTGEQ